jgi:hypothetical protein
MVQRKRKAKRAARLRVPRGVTIDGKGVGGRFTSRQGLADLVPRTDDAGRDKLTRAIVRERTRQQRAYERTSRRFDDDPKRYAEPLAKADADFRFWQQTEDDVLDLSDEDSMIEWEIGVDYHPVGGATSSHVDVNIRIRRTDNAPMGFTQAQRVMNDLRLNIGAGVANPVPRGYMVAGVDWRRPYQAFDFTEGTPDDFETFQNVLYIAADTMPWRLGGVDQ